MPSWGAEMLNSLRGVMPTESMLSLSMLDCHFAKGMIECTRGKCHSKGSDTGRDGADDHCELHDVLNSIIGTLAARRSGYGVMAMLWRGRWRR
jgi:hypothetical protein